MTARKNKSKKPSGGSSRFPSPPEDFVLYLDENLCSSRAILETLSRLQVAHKRHVELFPRGTPDETWLPVVGKNGWILLTADKRIRYNDLQKRALTRYGVREFVFASGNLSGDMMASALESAIPKLVKLWRSLRPPFVTSITASGDVYLRWPTGK